MYVSKTLLYHICGNTTLITENFEFGNTRNVHGPSIFFFFVVLSAIQCPAIIVGLGDSEKRKSIIDSTKTSIQIDSSTV